MIGTMPEITVIITIYNKEQYVGAAIESVCSQTMENIEILCVEDGSTDNSAKVVQEYARKDSRIRMIQKPNQGLVLARRTGVKHARGGYICFLDADDTVEPDMCQELYEYMERNDLDLVCAGLRTSKSYLYHGLQEGVIRKEELKSVVENIFYSLHSVKPLMIQNSGAKMYKRDLLYKSMEGIDPRLHFGEDSSFILPYLLECSSFGILHKCYYNIRYVEGSMSKAKDPLFFERLNAYYNHLYEVIQRYDNRRKLTAALDRYMAKIVIRGLNKDAGLGIAGYVQANFIFDQIKNIVIYGAGRQGIKWANKIAQSPDHNLVGVIDSNPEGKKILDYQVKNPKDLFDMTYDGILITVWNKDMQEEIRQLLLGMGIEEKKIITFVDDIW